MEASTSAGPKKKKRQVRPDVAARKKEQRVMRMMSIKCCLKKRLGDGEQHPLLGMIDELVVYATRCCRSWSLVFNRLLLDCMWLTGSSPAWLDVDNATQMKEVLVCCALRRGPHAPMLQPTFDVIGEALAVDPILSARQVLLYAASTYVTNFHNAMEGRVCGMLKRLFSSVFRQFGKTVKCDARAWTEHVLRAAPAPDAGCVTRESKAARAIESRLFLETPQHRVALGTSVAEDGHVQVRMTVEHDAGLAADWWANVERMPTKDRLEALWLIQKVGARWGAKGFSLAPVHTMQRKHVRVDMELFQYFFFPRLVELGVFSRPKRKNGVDNSEAMQGIIEMAFDTMFLLDNVLSEQGRLKWKASPNFVTDGYSMVVGVTSLVEKKPPKKRKSRSKQQPEMRALQPPPWKDFARGCEYAGNDPGEQNIFTFAGFDGSGQPWIRKLGARDLRIASGQISSERQAARTNTKIAPILDRLSRHTPKTGYPEVLQAYIDVCSGSCRSGEHIKLQQFFPDVKTTLEETLGGKKVVRRRMAGYISRRSCLDTFLASLPVRDRANTVIAYGAASWKHYTGMTVPTTAAYKAVKRMFRWVVLVEEFRTTITIYWTRRLCCTPKRWVSAGVSQEIRGLKCSKSIEMLGLLERNCLHRGAQLETEKGTGDAVVTFSRDGNAALNIRECIARSGRPRCLKRRSTTTRAVLQTVTLSERPAARVAVRCI
jgi:hypothetical protein